MIDRVEISVSGGKGGHGAVSFRREKFVPFGGPDGGDGGNGGSVVVIADPSVTDLGLFRHKGNYRAGNGEPGKGKKKHGRNGADRILAVPLGTEVLHKAQIGEPLIADLKDAGQRVVVAQGGKGGWGNARFASSTSQAPRIAQRGGTGEECDIILELKLIADVGIIGYPSVGKSTLLAAASAARPEIADYPFTTRSPVLGVVEVGLRNFVLAEIPGLIDGAHLGRGLGHEFLRHVARTRLLIHLVDGSSPSSAEDMMAVNAELGLYDSALSAKRQIIAVNKIDLPEVRANLPEIESEFAAAGVRVFFISAQTREGVSELMAEATKILEEVAQRGAVSGVPKKVFRPQPRVTRTAVHKEGDTFLVTAPGLERVVARVDETSSGIHWQLKGYLERLGVVRALLRAGVKPGDRVRCGSLEWEWE